MASSWKMSQSARKVDRRHDERKYGNHDGKVLPIHGTVNAMRYFGCRMGSGMAALAALVEASGVVRMVHAAAIEGPCGVLQQSGAALLGPAASIGRSPWLPMDVIAPSSFDTTARSRSVAGCAPLLGRLTKKAISWTMLTTLPTSRII